MVLESSLPYLGGTSRILVLFYFWMADW